jgi:hypothetical protein
VVSGCQQNINSAPTRPFILTDEPIRFAPRFSITKQRRVNHSRNRLTPAASIALPVKSVSPQNLTRVKTLATSLSGTASCCS